MWKTILTARLLIAYYTSKTKARDLRNFYITERSRLRNEHQQPLLKPLFRQKPQIMLIKVVQVRQYLSQLVIG